MNIAIYGRNISADDPRLTLLLAKLHQRAKVSFFTETPPADTDFVLSLGGDGTFLRAITRIGDRNIPIAGINFGRLGFLTSAQVDREGGNQWIEDLLTGRYSIEERILLEASSDVMPRGFAPYALNEFSIQRKSPAMLFVEISIDGRNLPGWWADGVVVSTPTGSTAYSLSVGGPIVTPNADVLIIAPVAPHNLNVRPIITPAESEITITFSSKSEPTGTITMDNRSFDAPVGSRFVITRAGHTAKCISFGNRGFIDAIREKLLWGEDRRNNF